MAHELVIPKIHIREFCHDVSSDGRICVLYKDHNTDGWHVENHSKSKWRDGE